ncbi:MAG: hypothetical protein NTZ07_01630 [Candidatus Woesebacteria bacterium]|nr:hypothetical protein [Candidatus Woesebacteria bacterium]
MKPKFITAVRYLILFLSILNALNLGVFGFLGKGWFGYQNITGTGPYTIIVFITMTSVLAMIFAHEFIEPKNIHSWLSLIFVWMLNIFALLFLYVIDLGEDWNYATGWIICLITMIVNTFVYFPYEVFQKHEAKLQ